ncbi:hypothetical protein [Fontibacillus sp. BL9]|uniref:hypothetical protein n=1 Tax=Fontibacillus sp. BL9 TaxID=3389971 RepID=UPI00397C8A1F
MKAIWRKEWIHDYETPWSMFEKLSLANGVNRDDILVILGNDHVKRLTKKSIGDTRRELFDLSSFDETTLELIFGLNIMKFSKNSIQSLTFPLRNQKYPIKSWFYQHLRWCKHCISSGYHSWFHQFKLMNYCPFHNCELLEVCPYCKGQIPFLLSNKQMGKPFSCKCTYELSDFSKSLWDSWENQYSITDPATLQWLSMKESSHEGKYLFFPEVSDLKVLVDPSSIISKVLLKQNENLVSIDDFYSLSSLSKELYKKNVDSFHTIDRYIRRKLVKDHLHCIRQFWDLLKNEDEEFPEICPVAYAYVNWRKALLKSAHFYRYSTRKNKVPLISGRYGYQLLTNSITDEIRSILDGFLMMKEEGVNRKILEWIQEQWTYQFSLNFFYNCLSSSSLILQQDNNKVLYWDRLLKKTKEEFKVVFRYSEIQDSRLKNILTLEMITKNKKRANISENQCPNNSVSKKRAISKMESFSPLRLAIDAMDGLNKKQIKYVEAYIKKHDSLD